MRRLLAALQARVVDIPLYRVGQYLGRRWAFARVGFDDGMTEVVRDLYPEDEPDEGLDDDGLWQEEGEEG